MDTGSVLQAVCLFQISKNIDGKLTVSIKNVIPSSARTDLPPKIEKFCFPYLNVVPNHEYEKKEDNFTFALTSTSGRLYGFCRRFKEKSRDYVSCIVILSSFSWYIFFRKVLDIFLSRSEFSWAFISSFVKDFKTKCNVFSNKNKKKFSVCIPEDFGDPTEYKLKIPDECLHPAVEYYLPILKTLGVTRTLILFSALLMERRILVVGTNLSLISSCVHSLYHMLHPFAWQNVFVPILPTEMLGYVGAPMPFLIGMHSVMFKNKDTDHYIEEVVVVNVDSREVLNVMADDFSLLPSEHTSVLRAELENCLEKVNRGGNFHNRRVVASFRHFFVRLFSTYPKYMVLSHEAGHGHGPGPSLSNSATNQGTKSSAGALFNSHGFIKSHPHNQRTFFRHFCQSQMFDMFVVEREELMKLGRRPGGMFEVEIDRVQSEKNFSVKGRLAQFKDKAKEKANKAIITDSFLKRKKKEHNGSFPFPSQAQPIRRNEKERPKHVVPKTQLPNKPERKGLPNKPEHIEYPPSSAVMLSIDESNVNQNNRESFVHLHERFCPPPNDDGNKKLDLIDFGLEASTANVSVNSAPVSSGIEDFYGNNKTTISEQETLDQKKCLNPFEDDFFSLEAKKDEYHKSETNKLNRADNDFFSLQITGHDSMKRANLLLDEESGSGSFLSSFESSPLPQNENILKSSHQKPRPAAGIWDPSMLLQIDPFDDSFESLSIQQKNTVPNQSLLD